MGTEFTGGRINNRLNLWPHGDMEGFWQIHGKDDYVPAMGQPGDITRFAMMILERMGDHREELPALKQAEIPEEVTGLAGMYRNDPGQGATMGGILMAAGLGMVREATEEARKTGIHEDGGVKFGMNLTELPFRLEIEE